MVPYASLIGEKFLLMYDNARPHATRIVDEFLHDIGLNRMVWPARSPDINFIEHGWGMLGKRVRSRLNVLNKEWNSIDQTDIQNLIERLNRLMVTVIQSREGNIRYY